jgi:amino acid adenylation domain-containing protein
MRSTESQLPVRGHACSRTVFVEVHEHDLEQSLVERFTSVAALHPKCLALRDEHRSVTYGELDAWSNGIARAILQHEDRESAPIALLLPQSAGSVVGIIGALKSASPYVSLDPADPRAPALIEHVGSNVLLTDAEHAQVAGTLSGNHRVIVVDETEPAPDSGISASPEDVAYLFFTSGSTGSPKGVFDSHRNVLHNVLRYTNTLRIAPTDRLSLIQSPAFSGTVSTLFSALLNGAAVFPFRLRERGIGALSRWLLDQHVTIYHSVPSIFRSLVEVEPGPFADVRVIRLEGDRATWHDVELAWRHFGDECVLVNGLGLTETGLVRQFFVDRDTKAGQGVLPIGYPVPNVEVTVLDEAGHSVAGGSTGELAVTSQYLALGYWNDPDLTNRAFPVVGGRRSYRTGDLGRIREDGCLEYLGRKDGQLKVLGNRVEPSDVEFELMRLAGVADAAVWTLEGRRGEGQLVANVTPDGSDMPTPQMIRDELAMSLPSYMIPSVIEIVPELPVGASGKLDRQRLAEAGGNHHRPTATDELERLVAHVWEDVLEIDSVPADTTFFSLGGDSLAAAEILARLEHQLGVPLAMSALLNSPTVQLLAEHMRDSKTIPNGPLAILRSDGSGAPLVLLHGNTGNVLHFSAFVAAAELGRPIWALEHPQPVDGIDAIARRHVQVLLEANPEGPHLLVGFCFGAIVAHTMACQLATAGHNVPFVGLLGITPLDFPGLISADAWDRWRRVHGPMPSISSRVRWHVLRTFDLPARERPRYVATRIANILVRTSRRPIERQSANQALRQAVAANEPETFTGSALVVLHADDTCEYTETPEQEWAPLAEEIELALLPGSFHAMLDEPGVRALETLLREAICTSDALTHDLRHNRLIGGT